MPKFPIVDMSPRPFAYVSRQAEMAEIPTVMQEGFGALMTAFGKAGASPAGMPYCHYTAYDDASATFDLGFPVAPGDVDAVRAAGLDIGETVSGQVMKGVHIGPYDTLNLTYEAMMAEMKALGLEGTVEMWEAYFSPAETPPDQTKTEVYWPVRAAA